jgi:hypothetical protein
MPINYKPASGSGSGSGSGSVADNAITLAKMAPGTDGNIISYDASGDPVAIATGTDGQVLTSTGAGSPPAFENAATGDALVANPLSQFAATTSAQLAGVISNETGSGSSDPCIRHSKCIGRHKHQRDWCQLHCWKRNDEREPHRPYHLFGQRGSSGFIHFSATKYGIDQRDRLWCCGIWY